MYTELINGEKWVILDFQTPKLPKVFETLSDSIEAALRISEPESPTRDVIELWWSRKGCREPGPLRHACFFVCEGEEHRFSVKPNSVPWQWSYEYHRSTRDGVISMALSLLNKWQCLLKNPARLPLLDMTKYEEDVLEVTEATTLMVLSEKVTLVMKVLSNAMKSVLVYTKH